MPPNDDEVRIDIGFDVSKREVAVARSSLRELAAAVIDFVKQDKNVVRSTMKATASLTTEAKAYDRVAKAQKKETEASKRFAESHDIIARSLRDENDELIQQLNLLEQFEQKKREIAATGIGISGEVAGAIGGLRGGAAAVAAPFVGGLGAVEPFLEFAEAIADFVDFMPNVNAQIEVFADALGTSKVGLVSVLTVAGVVSIAAGLAVKALTNSIKEQTEAVKAQAEARQIERDVTRDFQSLLEDGDLVGAIDERNRLFEESANLVRDLVVEEDLLLRARLESKGGNVDINPLISGIQTLNPLVEAQAQVVNDLVDKSGQANIALQAANDALAQFTEAQRDAALQAEELAKLEELRRQSQVAAINAEANLQRRLASAQNQSSEQIQTRIDAITTEDAILGRQIISLREAGENTDALTLELRNLSLESIALRDDILPLIQAMEREAIQIQKEEDFREDAAERSVKELRDARDRASQLIAINNEIEEAQRDHVATLVKIAENLSETLSEAQVDKSESLSEALREANDARSEAARDARLNREKLEEKHQKNLQKIIRKSNASIANAIADRDAVALLLAQRSKEEQLSEEKESFAESRKEINDELRETNRQIRRRLVEQRRTIDEQYTKMVARAREAARKQVDVENRKQAALIRSHFEASRKIVNSALNQDRLISEIGRRGATNAINIHSRFWQTVTQQAQSSLNQLRGLRARAQSIARISSPVRGSGAQATRLEQFQFGGIVRSTGPVFAHAGEQLLTRGQQARGGDGINVGGVRISVDGSNRKSIIQAVFKELDRALEEAGIS